MSKLMRLILPLLALVGLSEAISQVRQLQMRDAQIYLTQADSYAISANDLASIGWKTVSVNRGNVVATNGNCQQIQKTLTTLAPQEREMIAARKAQLESFFGGRPIQLPADGYSSASYDLISPVDGQPLKTSFSFSGENNFSITRPNLPNNLLRVTVYGDSVVFFTRDFQIDIRPLNCLKADEQQLVQQLRTEAKQTALQMQQQMQQAQQQFQQNMQQFQQNMQQWGQQMGQQLNQQFRQPLQQQQVFNQQSWMPWGQSNWQGSNDFNQAGNYPSAFPYQSNGFNQMQRPGWQQNQYRPQMPQTPQAQPSLPGSNFLSNLFSPQMW